ncbi:MAG: beta-lactamase family protein [Lachnospiraceae bacterium]|nr:beta-lactamase family protein [Lachnospiraceae bacterium]
MDFSRLTAYLDGLQETYSMPMGDLKIMRDHETVYRHSFGFSDLDRKSPLSDRHLFRLYSATKPVTMTAVLQLKEQGKLDLTDLLSDYLPEYEEMTVADTYELYPDGPVCSSTSHPAKRPIRLIDLMTMSAGFSYDTQDPNILQAVRDSHGTADTRTVIAALSKTPLMYEPGTRWYYSLAHDVLAAVVETVSGMRFSEYLRKNIFEPLGAEDLYFHFEGRPEDGSRVCDIYTGTDGTVPIVPADAADRDTYCFSPNYDSGGAGLIASVDAYSMIADALACGGVGKTGARILQPETVEMFRHAYTLDGQLKRDFDTWERTGYEYGLGVRVLVDDTCSKSPVGEFGWDGAAGAYVMIDTKNRLSVFYAEHVLGFPDNYYVIHPHIRDLVYLCLFGNF